MNEKDEIIRQLTDLREKTGGGLAIRLLLNVLGSMVPVVGGVLSASNTAWSEIEQQEFNDLVTKYISCLDGDICQLQNVLADQLRKPTKAAMSLLVGEVFGINLAEYGRDISFCTILHGETRAEFTPFIEKGWIVFNANRSTGSMGVNTRIGNSIEDRKRPWGQGNGFNVYITPEYFVDTAD